MMRRIGGLISVIAMLICIGVAALWVRSRHHADVLILRSPAGHAQGAAADHGGLVLVMSDLAFDGYVATTGSERAFGLLSPSPDEFLPIHDTFFDPLTTKAFLGFKLGAGQAIVEKNLTPRFTALMLPYWFLVLVSGAVALRSGRGAFIHWRRKRRGLCLGCGYDVRASTGRCPECGMQIGVLHPLES